MASVNVLCGQDSYRRLDMVAIECPFCHAYVTPNYLFLHNDSVMFAQCTNTKCNRHFVLGYHDGFDYVLPNSEPAKKEFSPVIRGISPLFESIYNQAFFAEQVGLNQICGVGYRKALEFLIKDYLISGAADDEYKEKIKNKFLGNCIKEDVASKPIRLVAERAVWLGNDETHYTRVWQDKDVTHLKQLIDLTIRWIESEVETKQLLEEMPERR